MPVHSIHIFDRKGKTLYTRNFFLKKDGTQQQQQSSGSTDPTNEMELQLSEQRKLVFGMIFSLREVVASLSPDTTTRANSSTTKGGGSSGGKIGGDTEGDGILHSVQTGACTLYSYETPSGLRFALFIAPANSTSVLEKGSGGTTNTTSSTTGNLSTTGGGSGGMSTSNTTGSSGNQIQQQQQQQATLLKQQQRAKSIRLALKHIYHELWIQCVTRSPLYTPTSPNVHDTNFEPRLEAFLKAQTWYK